MRSDVLFNAGYAVFWIGLFAITRRGRPDPLCMASVRGYEKYIYHYGKQRDEFYDLAEDPLEENNLAEQVPDDELERRRNDLLKWRSGAAATFERAKTEPE